MIELIKIVFAGVGCTFIITNSKLFKPVREWVTKKSLKLGGMISCPQCFGVYGGMISFLLVSYKIDILVYGLMVSLVSSFLKQ